METKTRIYKYALRPTDIQKAQLEKCGNLSRFLWNRLVKTQKSALHDIQNGRRATIENKYFNLLEGKSLVGKRVTAIKKIEKERGISSEEALKNFIKEATTRDTKIPVNKQGIKLLKWAARHLSWKYAVEKVNSERNKIVPEDLLSIWSSIQVKWIDFATQWDKNTFSAPKFKKFGGFSAIQKQIVKSSSWKFGPKVDLSWCGSHVLGSVEVIISREIPEGATVKQIAITRSPIGTWFLCVFLQADKSLFERHFTSTGKTVGIDPGIKSALVTSDAEVIQPKGLSKDFKLEKRLKKLQRKLDRQTRENNPHVFNDDGTWKKGKRITIRTKGMLDSAFAIADIKRHFKDAKGDYYHNAAIRLLNQYDCIGIGNAKMHKLVRGVGQAKKSMNTRVREHSISDFISKLQDKASLSVSPKFVAIVSEINTTKTCHKCKSEITLNLSDREWVCNNCGENHIRDVNAAINIRDKMLKDLAAGAQPVSEVKASKVRRSTKGKVAERSRPRSMENTSLKSGGLMQETFASVQVTPQISESACTSQISVSEQFTKVTASDDSGSPSNQMGFSQSQTCDATTQQLTLLR
jgi:transposase